MSYFPEISGVVTANQGSPNVIADAWPVEVINSIVLSGNISSTVNQGVAAVPGSGWPVKITDGFGTAQLVASPGFNGVMNVPGSGLYTASNLYVTVANNQIEPARTAPASLDGIPQYSAYTLLEVANVPLVFNGSTFDRQRSIAAVSGVPGQIGIPVVALTDGLGNVLPLATGVTTGSQNVTVSIPTQSTLYTTTNGGNPLKALYNSVWGNADAVGAGGNGIFTESANMIYNGSTWDRRRSAPNTPNPGTASVGISDSVNTVPIASGMATTNTTNFYGLQTQSLMLGVGASSNFTETIQALASVTPPIVSGPLTGGNYSMARGHLATVTYPLLFDNATGNAYQTRNINTTTDANISTSGTAATTSFGQVFNGTTWDRLRGSATSGIMVSGLITSLSPTNNAYVNTTVTQQCIPPSGWIGLGTTSTLILGANSIRKGLIMSNNSSNGQSVYLGIGTPAISGLGVYLAANGSFNMDAYSFTTQSISALATGTGNANLTYQEFE